MFLQLFLSKMIRTNIVGIVMVLGWKRAHRFSHHKGADISSLTIQYMILTQQELRVQIDRNL